MSLALLSPPTVEPLSLVEARLHLRVDGTTEDALVQLLIRVAREHAEEYTRRSFITQQWRMTLDRFPASDTIDIPRPTLQSVDAFTYVGTDGLTANVPSTLYEVDTISLPGRIALGYTQFWPYTRAKRNCVTLDFTCGYGSTADDVPAPIRAGMLLMLGHLYANREAIVTDLRVETLPFGVQALLGPYRYLESR